jgi:hypothetical protein
MTTGVYYSESKYLHKNLRKQPVRLERYIQKHARKDAQAIFAEHHQDQSIRVEPERIRSLAQFEANQFYQHGFIFLFLKASLLGNEQEVTNLYKNTFFETYTRNKIEYSETNGWA